MFESEQVKGFNSIEMILYNYIINNKKKIINMRIRDLADETHVSTTSIMRFCKKVNCDGFSEFKIKWKLFLDENKITCDCSDDNTMFLNFFEKVNYVDFKELIDSAAKFLNDSNQVIFIGVGSSGVLAKYGARYFSSTGKLSLAIDDPYYPVQSTDSNNNIVAIILSVSGETKNIIRQAMELRKERCKIISITNSANCTLAKMSNVNIPYYISRNQNEFSDLTSQVPVIYILETLAKKLHNYKNINNN